MGENRIKLVAADMDGTLLNRERKITKYTQNVIKKAMAQGVYFVPATGRAVNALPPELKEMEGIRYGIFSNGATIYDLKEEKVIYKNHFEMDRVLELMDFLKQFDLMESIYDCFKLNNDMKIPCVGFGTYKAAEGNNVEILKTAIEAGYRYFDTASFYQTEDFLGQAIRESNLPREDFFLVSKMWKDEMGYQQTKDALEKSLKRLGTDYLDIYLIHWPRPSADCENWKELDLETWRAMEELQKEGKIRGLGLSNFLPHHIKNILENGTVKPVVNQLELHPGYMQQAAVQYCKEHGIQMQAWSPIGRRRILEDGLILELAGKYQVSPAQLCLRFLLQNDIIPLPKSSSMERMKQNMDLFHFEISEEDVSRLATMPQAGWSGGRRAHRPPSGWRRGRKSPAGGTG